MDFSQSKLKRFHTLLVRAYIYFASCNALRAHTLHSAHIDKTARWVSASMMGDKNDNDNNNVAVSVAAVAATVVVVVIVIVEDDSVPFVWQKVVAVTEEKMVAMREGRQS